MQNNNELKNSVINIKKWLAIGIGFLFIFIITTSFIAGVGIQQNLAFDDEAQSIFAPAPIEPIPDVVVLQVGTDENVQLAVDTFLSLYPDTAKVEQITSWQELQDGILSFPTADGVCSH